MIPDKNETRLYIFGGTAIPFGNTATNDLHSFHLYGKRKWTWEKIECSGSPPVAGYGQVQYDFGRSIFMNMATVRFLMYETFPYMYVWMVALPYFVCHIAVVDPTSWGISAKSTIF